MQLELSSQLSFEEVSYLLWYGRLPSSEELQIFREKLALRRHPSAKEIEFVQKVPLTANPLAFLRTASSFIGMLGEKKFSPEEAAIDLSAKFPTVLAYFDHLRKGLEFVEPRPELSFAENYLRMLTGRKPPEEHTLALNAYFILLADYGLNSSTFSAIVHVSTLRLLFCDSLCYRDTQGNLCMEVLHRTFGRCFWKSARGLMQESGSRTR